jgi:hypothetical protein
MGEWGTGEVVQCVVKCRRVAPSQGLGLSADHHRRYPLCHALTSQPANHPRPRPRSPWPVTDSPLPLTLALSLTHSH